MASYTDILKDWKAEVLLPAIRSNIESAFPEMGFKKQGAIWKSPKHLFGNDSHSKDQSYYAPKYGDIIGDNSGEKLSFLDYVMRRDNCDLTTAEKTLAKAVGVDFPEYEESPEVKARREAELQAGRNRSKANEAYKAALYSGSTEANVVLNYLYGRGWTDAEIREAELGYIDEATKAGLPDTSDIAYTIGEASGKWKGSYTESIGGTHRLTIPFRNTAGNIIGFKFRNINYDQELAQLRTIYPEAKADKYLNSKGGWRSGNFFGYVSGQEAVVVEGELDALHASTKGAKNVIATTGGAVTFAAVEAAVKARITRFTLLFDTDEAGQAFVASSIPLIESAGGQAWVAYLPEAVKDLDEYFKAGYTLSQYEAIIAAAVPAYSWKLCQLVNKYSALEEENVKAGIYEQAGLTMKQREDFFTDVSGILNAPTMRGEDRQLFKEELKAYEEALRFKVEEYTASADSEYYRREETKQAAELTKAGAAIQEALKAGNYPEAARLMAEAGTGYNTQNKAQNFAKEFASEARSLDTLFNELKDGIPTGYTFKGHDSAIGSYEEELTLNVGLTFVCAPTSHGKTSFLNNVALNVAAWNRHRGSESSVLYFSYEIDRTRLLANLLNAYIGDADLSKIGKPLNAIYDAAKGNGSRYFTDGMAKGASLSHYDNYRAKKAEFERLIQKGDICVSDTSHKAGELLEAIRYYVKNVRTPAAIFVDYAQLIYDEDAKGLTRTEELKKIVNALKDLTKELQLPIVLAAQMKNDVISPLDVTIDNVGESKDLAMIADTTIGFFNLSKLHTIEAKQESKLKRLLNRLIGSNKLKGVPLYELQGEESKKEIQPIRGQMYAKVIKRRFGLSDIEEVLDFEARTGTIQPNKPEALKPQPEQLEITLPFEQPKQENSIPF